MIRVQIDGNDVPEHSWSDLGSAIEARSGMFEVSLAKSGEEGLLALFNESRCYLLYFRHDGDIGLEVSNTEQEQSQEEEFRHANGEEEFIPINRTVPREQAVRVIERLVREQTLDNDLPWRECQPLP